MNRVLLKLDSPEEAQCVAVTFGSVRMIMLLSDYVTDTENSGKCLDFCLLGKATHAPEVAHTARV